MDDGPQYRIVRMPMPDTGIGKEMGYEDDKALIAAAEAQRAKWPPEVRERIEAAEREAERRLLFGDGS